ncbi:TPA: PAS domain-containing protein [Klebsiella pneumoniae]|nr:MULTISPECIES: PAS domain-containing protein [Klebsiella]MDF7778779.1 PAS domain-containing protein [Klebsiella pneumoniae]MDP1304904.1 PAS domain-containing protein [Klebsiella pneumoniae]MDW7503870.1 PAS domain-containing protein [Klebsiella pneumoniae]MDX6133968.1 PAS domain-containing protein [Klebsiella sp. CN_Kp094]MDX6852868.1 PAS domain-containing protein [Klebsiella pneumoniae]
MRSTSIYIRNSNKQVIGAMCINLDISDILLAEKTLNKMAGSADIAPAKKENVTQVFVKDVNELLDCLIIAMSSGMLCNNVQHWPYIKTHILKPTNPCALLSRNKSLGQAVSPASN